MSRSGLSGGSLNRTEDGEVIYSVSQPFRLLSAGLGELLIDSNKLAFMLNEASLGRRPKIDDYTMQDTVLLLGYRLIHICPLNCELLLSHMDKSVHVGLTAFIRTLLVGLDGKFAPNTILTRLVTSIASLEKEPRQNVATANYSEELLLWVLLIAVAASTIGSVADDGWLMPRLDRIASALNLQKVEGVLQVVSKFPWMNALHDKTAHEIWRRFSLYKRRQATSTARYFTTCP